MMRQKEMFSAHLLGVWHRVQFTWWALTSTASRLGVPSLRRRDRWRAVRDAWTLWHVRVDRGQVTMPGRRLHDWTTCGTCIARLPRGVGARVVQRLARKQLRARSR